MGKRTRVQRIDEVLIQVSDAERSVRFYRDGLGIPFRPTGYGDGSHEAKVGEVRIVLHPDFDDSLKGIPRAAGVLLHPWVADVDAYVEELRHRGITIVEEPEDRPWGRHFAVDDPDGYRLHFLGPTRRRGPRGKR